MSDCFVRGMKTCLQSPLLDVSEVQISVSWMLSTSKTLSSELFLIGLWYQNSKQESSEILRNPLLRRYAPDGFSGWREVSSVAHRQKGKTGIHLSDLQESFWNNVNLVSFYFLWKLYSSNCNWFRFTAQFMGNTCILIHWALVLMWAWHVWIRLVTCLCSYK